MTTDSFGTLHRAINRLGQLPAVLRWRARRFDRQFERPGPAHLFRGVYSSFEAAAASAPTGRSITYNHVKAARLYVDDLRAGPHDYPAFFWLQRSFCEGMSSLVDVGGSIGTKYFAYKRLAPLPQQLRWLVYDMPAVAQEGRRLGTEASDPALAFTDRFSDADGSDVLYASGSLQYLPRTLAEMLVDLAHPPMRLVINATAVHAEQTYFTLNNIGVSYCAYRVQSRDRLVGDLEASGYALRDEWTNPGKRLDLPFEPGCSLDHYSGFCFDRRD